MKRKEKLYVAKVFCRKDGSWEDVKIYSFTYKEFVNQLMHHFYCDEQELVITGLQEFEV